MAGIAASINLTTPTVVARGVERPKFQSPMVILNNPWGTIRSNQFGLVGRVRMVRPVKAAPDGISEKVEKSIKDAEAACTDDPASGECVAAWDEVEELSAAASHARDKAKQQSDPLENYCKDNPETDECRTYDN